MKLSCLLLQADFDNPNEQIGVLLVLECSSTWQLASKSVCGQVWLDNSADLLNEKEKINIQFVPSSSVYHFRDGKTFNTVKKTQLPANTGGHQAIIETNVIDSDMPRLLSRSSMK